MFGIMIQMKCFFSISEDKIWRLPTETNDKRRHGGAASDENRDEFDINKRFFPRNARQFLA